MLDDLRRNSIQVPTTLARSAIDHGEMVRWSQQHPERHIKGGATLEFNSRSQGAQPLHNASINSNGEAIVFKLTII